MQFKPKTDTEIEKENAVWPAGIYDFKCADAKDDISQNGNEMIVLTVNIVNPEGHSISLKDWLLEKVAFKLKHAAYSMGLEKEYENGFLIAQDFVNKSGKLHLTTKTYIGNDGQKRESNAIKDYFYQKDNSQPELPGIPSTAHQVAKQNGYAPELNDEVPF